MDAALVGLAGTTVGAFTGFAGAWLAQRGQIRLSREQRSHDAKVRWVDDKKALYRDLLVAMYGWHDALVSYWHGQEDFRELLENRTNANNLVVEVSLISAEPVRTAVKEARQTFLNTQPHIFDHPSRQGQQPSGSLKSILGEVRTKIQAMEAEMRRELVALR